MRELIRRLAFENGWRARKIQGELTKLGFAISLVTVSRYLPKHLPDPHRRQRKRDLPGRPGDEDLLPTQGFQRLPLSPAIASQDKSPFISIT